MSLYKASNLIHSMSMSLRNVGALGLQYDLRLFINDVFFRAKSPAQDHQSVEQPKIHMACSHHGGLLLLYTQDFPLGLVTGVEASHLFASPSLEPRNP